MQDQSDTVGQSTPLAYILKHTTSQNNFLRQAAIVYGATTDVLTPTVAYGSSAPTAYFGAFLSSLEEAAKQSKPDSTLLGALCYLLLQIYPHVNASVIVSLTDQVSTLFISVLKKHADISYVAKNLLGCVSYHIRIVSVKAPSRGQTILKMIQALLVFSVDPRPKIRKDAQKDCETAYSEIAKASKDLVVPKVFEDVVVQFVKFELSNCDAKNCQSALHLCGLLQLIIYYLSLDSIAKVIAPLIQLTATIGNPFLLIQTCLTIDHLFLKGFHVSLLCAQDALQRQQTPGTASSSSSSSSFNLSPYVVEHLAPYVDSLPQAARTKRMNQDAEFASQLLGSLIDLQPNIKDAVSIRAFDICTLRVYNTLHHLHPSYALQHVLRVLNLFVETILSDNQSIRQSAANTCRSIIRITLTAPQLTIALQQKDSLPAQILHFLDELFSLPHTSLSLPISIIEASMEHATIDHLSLFSSFILRIDEYHRGADQSPALQQYCEDAIARAITSFGPDAINQLIPINYPSLESDVSLVDQLNQSRPWLLQLFAKHVRLSQLAYFRQFLLPHANLMLQYAQTSLQQGHYEEAKIFQQFLTLTWDTLPAFGILPTDVEKEIKPLMKEIVNYYTSEELSFTQIPICKTLRVLAAKNLAIAEGRWGIGNDLGIQPLNVKDNAHLHTTRKFKLTQRTRTEDVISAEDEDSSDESDDQPASSGDNNNDDDDDSDDSDSDDDHNSAKRPQLIPPITIEQAKKNVTAIGSISKNILPLLFNTVLQIFENDTSGGADNSSFTFLPILLDTILAFSFVTPASVRTTLFTRAFENFVETTKEMNALYAQIENGDDDDDDDDDNMTIFEAMSKNRPTMADLEPLTRKARGLCDILISLAPSLDMACSELLLKAVMVHFNSFSDVLQKKSYQTVAQLLTLNRTTFNAFWLDVLKGLTLSAANVQPGSSKTRLALSKVIFCLVPEPLSQPDVMKTMPSLVSEAILSIKESNAKLRETAFETIVGIAYNILNSSDEQLGRQYLTQYLTMVLAGLAANTPRMLSATVTVVARLIYEFRTILEPKIVTEIFQTILIMLPSKSREVLKAVLGLVKVAILSLDTESLRPHVRELLYTISDWSPDIKSRFKRKVRLLYTFLLRRFGVEYMRSVTPSDDSRLIEYLRKMHARIQKQKTRELNEKRSHTKEKPDETADEDIDSKYHNQALSFDDLLTMDDDDSDDMGDGSAADFLSKSVKAREGASKKSKRDEVVQIGDDTDFLDPSVSAKLAKKVKPSSASRADIISTTDTTTSANKRKSTQFTASGKIDLSNLEKDIIDEHKAKKQAQRQPSKQEIEQERKRKRELLKEREELRQKEHMDAVKQRLGKQFAATRAAGDVKRKGQKFDPFAYVPLDPRNLNQKKKSFKAQVEAFSGMFSKSGSKLGQKLKRSQRAALKKKGGRFKKIPELAD